jgi:hypothetical protein
MKDYSFAALGLSSGVDHFFRLAVSHPSANDLLAPVEHQFNVNGTTQDFTDPIALSPNGTWVELG